eukprot:TRINITY_DN26453_c0_g1_i1.p1 TRINITY_DN26453_c0_g1~~TRINITY_DN26453_c0_g1_i1.p1  ORF type:complete len:292 (+),score=65.92 TRINITY_DN26453_c0_g1_i1:155-1030(+)
MIAPSPAMDAVIRLRVGGAASLELAVPRNLRVAALQQRIAEALRTVSDAGAGDSAEPPLLTRRGEELRGELPLWAYHLEDGDVVVLDEWLRIYVTGCERRIVELRLLRSTSVAELKRGLQQIVGVPAFRQQLSCRGKPLARVDEVGCVAHEASTTVVGPMAAKGDITCSNGDDLTLWECGLRDGEHLELDESMYVQVVGIHDKAALVVEARSSSTGFQLKRCIKDEVGIPICNQRLFCWSYSQRGEELRNGLALRDYGIKHSDVLLLERASSGIPEPGLVPFCVYRLEAST